MKAAAKLKNETLSDLQDLDVQEEKKGIVPVTLCSCDFRQFSRIEPESIDWVITDPPYSREHLPLYSDLARCAARWLKPGGSLLAMSGQSYLLEVSKRDHLADFSALIKRFATPLPYDPRRRVATEEKIDEHA
jgi:16S rRNA G966 N2-methylase RsmD